MLLTPVQKLASAFLYISHTSRYLMGNMQKRSGFSSRSGSATWMGPTMLPARLFPYFCNEQRCEEAFTLREAGAWRAC